MNKREKLEKMTVDELRRYASQVGFKGARKYKKAELIEELLKYERESKKEPEEKKESEASQAAEKVIDMEKKMPYIESAEIGTIIAFKLHNGKVKSAKIIKRSTASRRLMVETKSNATYVIDYNAVIWVRRGIMWPNGVYRLLKGIDKK